MVSQSIKYPISLLFSVIGLISGGCWHAKDSADTRSSEAVADLIGNKFKALLAENDKFTRTAMHVRFESVTLRAVFASKYSSAADVFFNCMNQFVSLAMDDAPAFGRHPDKVEVSRFQFDWCDPFACCQAKGVHMQNVVP